ncbi:MAG: HupE/UreJ family protein [Pseudomonadota bacterium]
MDSFPFYVQVGFRHISDLAGYDHILFLVALCAVYRIEHWRKIVVLVTAFTVGHSLTLALAALGTIAIPSRFIEFLIPVTILLTAISNLFRDDEASTASGMGRQYFMALFFGLIHGMGFSNYFRALLMGDSSVVLPLLGFNIGIELGQLLVVLIIMSVSFCFLNLLRTRYRDWNVFVSGAASGMSLILMIDTKFW